MYFFFQVEDGIRDWSVTGVQTCALPMCALAAIAQLGCSGPQARGVRALPLIGRASCRERSYFIGAALLLINRCSLGIYIRCPHSDEDRTKGAVCVTSN